MVTSENSGENDICTPSPCGDYASCTKVDEKPLCTCQPGFTGNPLKACTRVECQIHSECQLNKACSNEVCVDPCPGACVENANCTVRIFFSFNPN